jgi:hypothetical protein
MKTIVIRNNTDQEQIWLRTFLANEEYEIPSDNTLPFRYANLESLLSAISNGNASIGNGDIFYTSVNDQLNYLKGIDLTPKDSDGATIIRQKAARAGWTYHLTAAEFCTSVVGSLYHKDYAGNNLNEFTVKFYDSNDVELTTVGLDTSCVKTVIDFEPPWDYEVIGGTIKTIASVPVDLRTWVIAVPDVPTLYGGSKVMVQSVNLKFIDPNNGIEADGRASKFMVYNETTHTNKIRLITTHPAGHAESIMFVFEVFKQ